VARAPDGHVALALHDYYLQPTQVRTRAGRVRFDVVDRGRIGHNLRVFRSGRTYLSISTLKPGERATPTVELPRGAYQLFCSVANHQELGLRGALIVR
jgi:plastocyanin